MKKLMFFLLIVSCSQVNGQYLSPTSINIGGSSDTAHNLQLSHTLGQLNTSSVITPNYQITEGFQQSVINTWIGDSLSYFEIGNIPDWDLWQNVAIEFHVMAGNLAGTKVYQIEYDSLMFSDEDILTIDSISGHFLINLTSSQMYEFPVVFSAISDSGFVSQQVMFSLNETVPPEGVVFGLEPSPELPSENDNTYITTYIHHEDASSFNHLHSTVRYVCIAGKEIIIENGHPNNIYNNYNGISDIGQLEIYAEKVVVNSQFHLPQTNVIIHARELRFEDPEGKDGLSYISTVPLTKQPTVNGNGVDGLKAGNITLHIDKFYATLAFRFILEGGQGQKSSGSSFQSGDGGDGGNLYSTLLLNSYSTVFGGSAGFIQSSASYGVPGEMGTMNRLPYKMSWLHPLALQSILRYTNDAYYFGYYEVAKDICEDYYIKIAAYQQLEEEFLELPDSQQADLIQLKQEFQRIAQQIGSNKDYYGNPAGWAPMLSFEIASSMYNQEIDKAINLYYLSYYVTHSMATLQLKQIALENTMSEQQDLLETNIDSFEDVFQEVPLMEINFQGINNEMLSVVSSLESFEQSFREEALNLILQDYYPVCSWQCGYFGWLGFDDGYGAQKALYAQLEMLLNSVIAEEPGIGFNGNLEHLYPNYNNPIGAITETFNLFEELSNQDWSSTYSVLLDSLNTIDPDNLTSLNNISEIVLNSQLLSEPILDFGNQFDNLSENVKIGLKEYLVYLDDIRSKRPEYENLANQLDVLKQAQMELYLQFIEVLSTTSQLSTDIQSGILTIDALNRDATYTDKMLDARALQYLYQIEQKAKDRLKKYHYYMAKAYEYRFLVPFDGNLNIDNITDKFLEFFAKGPLLSVTDFGTIKSLYQQELSSIAENIYTYWQNNWGGGSYRATKNYYFSEEQLEHINSGQGFDVDFQELQIFSKDKENIRIVDISVEEVSFEMLNGNINAETNMYFTHSGNSRIKKDGNIYLFKNYTSKTEFPIFWGASIQADGDISPHIIPTPSSMLASITGYSTNEELMAFAYPAGWGDFELKKIDEGDIFTINSMKIKVTYDYSPSQTANIEVIPQILISFGKDKNSPKSVINPIIPIMPVVSLSSVDLGGRKNGQGYINRAYTKTPYQNVNIEVEQKHGSYAFVDMQIESSKGKDEDETRTVKSSKETLNLGQNHRVRIRYEYLEPVLNTIEDTLYVAGVQVNDTIHIQNIGNGTLCWGATTNLNWISFVGDNWGENDTELLLQFSPNETGETRIGHILVINGESFFPFDTVWVVQENYGENTSIQINQGWSGLSSFIQPNEPLLETVFEDISDEVEMLQNMDGFYWPGQNINTLGSWDMTSGYAIKARSTTELSVSGNRNYSQTINLSSGWSMIPVLSSCEVNVNEIFSTLPWNLKIAKEVAGTKVYWPEFFINTIGNLEPGNAYYVYLLNNGYITFEDCEDFKSTVISSSSKPIEMEPWGGVQTSNNTHAIAIPQELSTNSKLLQGDILGAFAPGGSFLGYTEIQSGLSNSIMVFGKDVSAQKSAGIVDGSQMLFKVYRPETDQVFDTEVTFMEDMPNQELFATNGISALKSISLTKALESSIRVFPNPASTSINIDCGVFENIQLNIYDMYGKIVFTRQLSSGNFSMQTGETLKPGVYNFEFSNEAVNLVKRVVIK